MNLIAAVDKNWAIGCKNKLLVSIPADMKFFRGDDNRESGRHGKKNVGEFSKRTASQKKSEHRADA